MDMLNCRTELHVAQQSRRDKLRSHQLNDFSNAWDNTNSAVAAHQNYHQIQPGTNPDLIEARLFEKNVASPHNSALIPPGLIGFLPNQISIPYQAEAVHAYQDCATMFMNVPQAIPSSMVLASARDGSPNDTQGCSIWKTIDASHPSCNNWAAMNYGDVLPNNLNVRNSTLDRPLQCSKLMNDADYNAARSSLSSSEISTQDNDKKYHLNPLYLNCFQNNVVTVACSGSMPNDTRESANSHGSWSGNSRGELVFLPSYGNQHSDSWLSRPVGINVNQWSHASCSNVTRKCIEQPRNVATASAKKDLSLSLLPEIPKPSIISKPSGKSLSDVVMGGDVAANSVATSVNVQRHIGPLGPFTGYATILKSSRFLKPAQLLLDEFCNAYVARVSCRSESNSMDAADKYTGGVKCNNDPTMLSSTIRNCNDVEGCSSSEPFKPENRVKKAKLNLLQEEVCRRFKLYNQQMQTVVSSFESVAGLSTATPYISLALRRISKSFRSLRTAIADQLMQISRLSGNNYDNTNQTSYTKFTDRNNNNNLNSVQKQRLCNNVEFLEPQSQHIWRPQRGLPERAVAILRAWLFDHFLHPYPTDTDKQMLATQTGLSRSQVSNWFINARVRVWKPMVEEMHMLETKAMAAASDANHQNVASNIENSNRSCNNHFGCNEITSKQSMELQGSSSNSNINVNSMVEKRSRVEYTRGNVDLSGLMGFMPYGQQRGGFDGGLGNVSLTLGLRHGVDSVPQMQTQTHEHEFGGNQMLHDFVG